MHQKCGLHDDKGTGDVVVVTANRVPITVNSAAPAVSMGVDLRAAV